MIEFILNNTYVNTEANAGITLLDFIRENKQLKGTKIGCREGDCGACTVLVGFLNDKEITYQSITSCISPLGNAHGKHIVTVEGINLENRLNTSQKAMAENYATQCGFCTPGFVMSLTGFVLNNKATNYFDGLDAISGNICRCTGYKSIEKAVKYVTKQIEERDQKNKLIWLIDNGFLPDYFANIPKKLQQLNSKNNINNGVNFVAGGTDLYVRHADRLSEEEIHLLAADYAIRGISFYKNTCVMGASTTATDIMYNNAMSVYVPDIKLYLKLVSSEQIRNMATLAGNFVNASPIGDMTILFLALDSKITVKNAVGKLRTIALKDFYKAYKEFDLNREEIITNISFDVPNPEGKFNFEKISKRTHLDIASVNSAIYILEKNGTIINVQFSIGGVAPIPKYLHETVAFLKGKNLSIDLILEANTIMQKEIAPISDVRGSSEYKRLLAKQLLFAHFSKLYPEKFNLKELVNG